MNKNKILKYDNYSDLFVRLTECEYVYHYMIFDNINCSSNFENVLKDVFNYPLSFKIPDEYIYEYSNQQIDLIEKTKKALLEMEYNDIYDGKCINYNECIKRNDKKYCYYFEYQNNKNEFERIEKRIKLIINIILIVLLLWISFFITDNICIKNKKNPVFMINVNDIYYGLFYKSDGFKIGTYFMKIKKNRIKVIDETKACSMELEKFYSDFKYDYYFECIKAANVKIIYENKEYSLKNSFDMKIITIDDLKNKIDFIMIEK